MSEEELEIKTEAIDIDEDWLTNPVFSNSHSKVKTLENALNDVENKNDFVSVDVNFVKCEFPEEFIDFSWENVEGDP